MDYLTACVMLKVMLSGSLLCRREMGLDLRVCCQGGSENSQKHSFSRRGNRVPSSASAMLPVLSFAEKCLHLLNRLTSVDFTDF